MRHFPWKRVAVGLAAASALGGGWVAYRHLGKNDDTVWKVRDRGIIAFQAGDFGGAAKEFQAVLARAPRDTQAWYMLGSSHRAAKLPRDVWMPSIEKAVEIDPGFGPATALLAAAYVEAGEAQRAVPLARNATKAQPDDANNWRLLGTALLRLPSPPIAEAERAFTKARLLGDTSPSTLVSVAETRLRLTGWLPPDSQPPELVEAIREASAALERSEAKEFGGDGPVSLARAQMSVARGDARAAHEIASAALNRLADTESTRELRAQLLLARGRSQAQIGDAAGAGADVLSALQANPTYDVADECVAIFARAGLQDDVIAVLQRALDRDDPKRQIRTVVAEQHLLRGKADLAEAVLGEGSRPETMDVREQLARGDIAAASGKLDEAKVIYLRCAESSPRSTTPVVRLASLALRGDASKADRAARIAESLAALEAARKRIGDDPAIAVAVGRLQIVAGDVEKAREEFRKVTVAEPGSSDAWRYYGEACIRDGADAAAAAQAFRRARLLSPRDAELPLLEAESLLMSGDPGGATAVCSTLLRDRPADLGALRLRARASRQMGLWSAAVADLRALYNAGERDDQTVVAFVESLFAANQPNPARAVIAEVLPNASQQLAALLEGAAALHEVDGMASVQEQLQGAEGRGVAAVIFLLSGRIDDAIAAAKQSLALAPGNTTATRALVLALVDGSAASPERIAQAREAALGLADPVPEGLRELLEGRVLIAERKFPEARAALERAAESMGSDPVVAMCLGIARVESGEAEAGLVALRTAIAMPGAGVGARRTVARYVLRATAALDDLRRRQLGAVEALELDPASADAALAVAAALSSRGEYRSAADILERSISLAGAISPADVVRLRWSAAAQRLNAGDTQRALAHLDALPQAERDGPSGKVIRGFAHLRDSRFGDAERAFDEALAADPGNRLAVVGGATSRVRRRDSAGAVTVATKWLQGGGDPGVAVVVGRLLAANDQLDAAVDLARRVRTVAPTSRAALELVCEALGRKGNAADALAEARSAVEATGGLSKTQARLVLGSVLRSITNDHEAGLAIAKSVRATADATPEELAEGQVLEAECLAALDRTADAAALVATLSARWVDDRPETAADRAVERRVRFSRGLVAAAAARYGDAARDFARCHELDPRDAPCLNNLAWTLAQEGGDPAAALQHAMKLTALEPTNPSWWDTRGTAAAAARNADDADRSWNTALELFRKAPVGSAPAHAATAMRLARLLHARGRTAEAAVAAREALTLVPKGPLADEARQLASQEK